MAKIGFIYSTVDGHTVNICRHLAEIAAAEGYDTELLELTPASSIDLAAFDKVVIGASIRYGKHRPEVIDFINKKQSQLEDRHGALFSVNAVARKAEKRGADTNPYMRKLLATIDWQPSLVGVFGGRIVYAKYGWVDRTMIRFIMWVTKGPTDLSADVDFTDWDEVERFGRRICAAGGEPAHA